MQDIIKFPEQAKAHFDEQAKSFIADLKPLSSRTESKIPHGSIAQKPVLGHLKNDDIIEYLEVSRSGISIADELLRNNNPTDLENYCLAAISHFSRGVASPSPQDRLVHAIVAVESLLLKDQNEPVLYSLSHKVALLTSEKLEDRKKTKSDFKKGYQLRSQFFHHGVKLEDVETANQVL